MIRFVCGYNKVCYDEFRDAFIRPLLTKMGFLTICELDGSQEFGKDFVFSELTPFGFFRHYGVVVKHEKAVRQSASQLCQTVLAQVRQVFSVSFRVPEASAESKVASVLFMNSQSGNQQQSAISTIRGQVLHYNIFSNPQTYATFLFSAC